MPDYKFDIFVVLQELDQNNYRVYEELEGNPELLAEYCKALGWILPLWMIGASREDDHARLLMAFNEDCNRFWYKLKDHPKLQSKLLAGVGLGRRTNHKFFKASAPNYQNEVVRFIQELYPDARRKEIELWIRLNEPAQFKELAEEMGWQIADLKELLKTYTKMRKALCRS